jgi:hypothetical protein
MQWSPDGLPASGTILHVGCGRTPLPEWLCGLSETRLDIDPDCEPDVVGSMTDLGEIGAFDAVFSSHALEHLKPNEVDLALAEFLRVISPGGAAFVIVPDLEDVRPTDEVLYESPAGPVTGLDMYYGMARLFTDAPYMQHQTGFVSPTLKAAMERAGFKGVSVHRLGGWTLFGFGVKQ